MIPSVKEIPKTPQDMLSRAIMDNSSEDVRKAVQAGADVNQNMDGKSPLMMAVLLKSSKAVEGLLEFGAKDPSLQKVIESAINLKDTKTAVLIERKYGRLNTLYLGHPLLSHALSTGDVSSALALVKNGADFSCKVKNFNNSSVESEVMEIALRCAGNGGIDGLELVQELINRGYNVNDVWALGSKSRYDILGDRADALKIVLKNGANPNFVFAKKDDHITPPVSGSFWTPLVRAAYLGSKASVKCLLEHGAEVNQQASPNIKYPDLQILGPQTPLSIAVARGWSEIVKILVEHGAKN